MNQYVKLAALRLASVSCADKAWVIAQLPLQTRDLLVASLQEIEAMCLDNPISVYEQLRNEVASRVSNIDPTAHGDAYGLANLTSVEANMLFEGMPVFWLLHLFQAREWPWLKDYMENCTPERKNQIRLLAREKKIALPSKLFNALLEETENLMRSEKTTREEPNCTSNFMNF